MQPSLFDTAELPFAAPIDVSPGPAESSAPASQLPLLEPNQGQETDCVDALLAGRWADAGALLERLRERVTEQHQAEIDAALPLVRDLACRPAMHLEAQLKHVANAARFTAANCWVRHTCLRLVRQALASVGSARLARALDERALPFVYALLRTHAHQPDAREARALLREAFLASRHVPLQSLGDAAVLELDASDVTPAWYPVLGAMLGLWPSTRLSASEADAVLDAPTPTDDVGTAHHFWACYCAWKSQREPNGHVTRARMLMKQLNPVMFARLK